MSSRSFDFGEQKALQLFELTSIASHPKARAAVDCVFLHRMTSEHSSSDESSQVSSSFETTAIEKQEQKETSSGSFSLAKAQSRAVCASKVLVLAVIFIAAIVCGITTYKEVRSRETDDFTEEVRASFCSSCAPDPRG
jgi:hypothetical protein